MEKILRAQLRADSSKLSDGTIHLTWTCAGNGVVVHMLEIESRTTNVYYHTMYD